MLFHIFYIFLVLPSLINVVFELSSKVLSYPKT
jgi:hypothetical protein